MAKHLDEDELRNALEAIGQAIRPREANIEKQQEMEIPQYRTTAPFSVPKKPLYPPVLPRTRK